MSSRPSRALARLEQTIKAAALVTLTGALSCSGALPPAAASRAAPARADVETRDLPPKEEIEGLLRGSGTIGRAHRVVRVAIPPFRVIGSDKPWVGDAAAEVLIAKLSHAEGVSLLERGEMARLIEELKKANPDREVAASVSAGKLLGAQSLILGSLVPQGDGYRLVLKPVRVEDGVVLLAVESVVSPGAWDQMQSAVEPLTKSLDLAPGAVASTPSPLTAEQLERVSEARELQYRGELVAAEKIYSSALVEPSSSWRAESDYIQLMADLGMKEWAEDRAARVLASMPKDPTLICETARMMIQSARVQASLAELREAVRMAASCGDRFVIAHALYRYSSRMWTVHVPTARAALDEARRQLGEGAKETWLGCALDLEVAWDDYAEDHDGAGRERIFQKVGEECTKVSNHDIAARSFRHAGIAAVGLAQRRRFFEQAVEQAEHAGGMVRDRARIELADEHTRAGRSTEADDLVLAELKEHLAALAGLQGGLADPEARLDDELLRRVGVERGAPRDKLDPATMLLVKTHRRALANGLRWWATRTRIDSVPQAGAYDDVASALDPPEKPASEDADKAFEARLGAVKLSVDTILREARPLRGSGVDLVEGLGALWSRYWTLKARGAKAEQLDDICKAMTTAAEWLDNDHWRVIALQCQSDSRDHAGQFEAAVGILRGARTYTRSPETQYQLVHRQAEIVGRTRHADAVKLYEEARDLAKQTDVSDRVSASFLAEYERIQAGEGALDGTARLVALSKELEAEGELEVAAAALVKAASLWDAAAHAIGTPDSTLLSFERARVLDKLGDPLRSARAWVDVLDAIHAEIAQNYRGNADKVFALDPRAKTLISDVKERLDAFVARGRKRDAARIGTRLLSAGAPELVDTVTEWARSFEDSSEFPEMMGWILQTRADGVEGDAKLDLLRKSRDYFVKAHDVGQAVWLQRSVLKDSTSEDLLWRELQACADLAKSARGALANCFDGVAGAAVTGVELHDAERARAALALGITAQAEWKQILAPDRYVDALTALAGVAVVARDMEAYRSIDAEVRTFYTKTSPDAYQLVTYFSRLASLVRPVDPRLAVSIYRDFEHANGASCFWKSGSYAGYASAAHDVGELDAEREFVTIGRSCAEETPKYLVRYDLYLVPSMQAKSDYEGIRRAFEAAQKTLKRVAPGYLLRQDELALSIAATNLLQRRAGPARKALAEAVKHAVAAADGATEAPCFESLVLEASASVELAAGACVEAKKLETKAATLRSRCKARSCISVAGLGDTKWCDDPAELWLRADNACGKPPAGVEKWIRR